MGHQLVLVVDFGGQYSQLIVRRVREFGVYSEMVPWMDAADHICARRPDAIILSGGPRSVMDPDSPDLDFSVIEGIPTLGICYGQQLMAYRLGGEVELSDHKEYGFRLIEAKDAKGTLIEGIDGEQVWMIHGVQVLKPPTGTKVTAVTATCPVAAFEGPARKLYAVQFHPEVSHTPFGKTILKRFLFDAGQLDRRPVGFAPRHGLASAP